MKKDIEKHKNKPHVPDVDPIRDTLKFLLYIHVGPF